MAIHLLALCKKVDTHLVRWVHTEHIFTQGEECVEGEDP